METKVINGQPQISSTFGNRIVTYDGLVDFLEMLKDEIPRMGYNNTILGRSYSFGTNNEGQGLESFLIGNSNHVFGSRGFAFGYQNYLGTKADSQITYSYNFAIGEQNQLYASWASAIGQRNTVENLAGNSLYSMIIGFDNHILDGGKHNFIIGQHNYSYQNNTYLLGEYLNSLGNGSNSDFSFWIGKYNKPKENIVFGIGNGENEEKRSNVFAVTSIGSICLSEQFETGREWNNLTSGVYVIADVEMDENNIYVPPTIICLRENGSQNITLSQPNGGTTTFTWDGNTLSTALSREFCLYRLYELSFTGKIAETEV